jgi:D-alanyl-D-alanine carboxypeptidase (penicillin-binding protein 5/6)
MNHPVISEIVGQTSADLPVAGTVSNVNFMLDQDGIVGVKTGNTDQAGGCFMFAARREIEGQKVTVVGTVMGAPNLYEAINGSKPLIDEAFKNFHNVEVVKTGQILGKVHQSGGNSATVRARQGLRTLVWIGQAPSAELVGKNLGTSIKQGDDVGTLQVHVGNQIYPVTAEASGNLISGSVLWRLTHAAGYL